MEGTGKQGAEESPGLIFLADSQSLWDRVLSMAVCVLPLPPSAPQNLFFKLSVTGQIAAWAAPIEKVKITTYTFFNFPALQVHKIIPTSGTVGDQT